MKTVYFISVCIILLVLSSCSQKSAYVEFKGYTFYGKDYYEFQNTAKKDNRRNLRDEKPDNEVQTADAEDDKYKEEDETIANSNGSNCKIVGAKEISVSSGDTLYGIAIRHDIPAKKIIELNNLKEPYQLSVGQKLKVSEGKMVSNSSHVVKSGENLIEIAKKYNTNKAEIAKLNNLRKPYLIKIGQKLNIPSDNNSCIASNKRQDVKVVQNNPKTPIKATPENKNNNFIWPIKGTVISKFGPKEGSLYNDGINISATKGSEFKATEDGVIAYVGNELKGYGNLIIIKHAKNWVSAYAHADSVNVGRGDVVKKGQTIGKVGETGNVKTSQLYFGLRKGRKAVDPQKYLR